MTEIRRAGLVDARPIAETHVGAWRWAYRGLVSDAHLDGMSVGSFVAFWERELAEPESSTSTVLVSVDHERVRGFIATGRCRDDDRSGTAHGEIYALYLDPAAVGRGHGRALLQAGVLALSREVSSVSAWVLEANARGRAFYEARGFTPDGAREQAEVGGALLSETRYAAERTALGKRRGLR